MIRLKKPQLIRNTGLNTMIAGTGIAAVIITVSHTVVLNLDFQYSLKSDNAEFFINSEKNSRRFSISDKTGEWDMQPSFAERHDYLSKPLNLSVQMEQGELRLSSCYRA